MTRLACFLRGINLGSRRVKMAELRRPFEAMGLEGVESYLASGNVVFDDPGRDRRALEEEIEAELEAALGFATEAFVRGLPGLADLLDHELVAGAGDEGFTPYVVFLKEAAGADVEAALEALETPDDRLHFLGREIVWRRRGGISDSPISPADFAEAVGGRDHTRRKASTLRRIVAKFGG